MMTLTDRTLKLEREIMATYEQPYDTWEKAKVLKDEQKRLLAEASLDKFLAAKDALFELRHPDVNHEWRRELCVCGHPRGHHNTIRGCCVGNRHWNSQSGRSDAQCCCQGFITPEGQKRLECEEAEAKERERAESLYWCEECEQGLDELDTRYECGNCGAEFGLDENGSNRCPDCGKFAARVGDNFCPTCGNEIEEV